MPDTGGANRMPEIKAHACAACGCEPGPGLEALLARQRAFTETWLRVRHGVGLAGLSDVDRERIAKDFCLALIDEVMEALRLLNWKSHRWGRKPVDRERLLEELIDVWKFHLNLALLFGFGAEDLYRMWIEKTARVEARFADELGAIVKGGGTSAC